MAYQKILLTLDGSSFAETALRYVPGIADPQAAIHLLSVIGAMMIQHPVASPIPHVSTVNIPYMLPPLNTPCVQQIANPTLFRDRLVYLQETGNGLRQSGFKVILNVEPGNTVDTIIAKAKEGFDLLVMATHGRGGLTHLMLGSVAEAVLHRAPCPVLLIPAKAATWNKEVGGYSASKVGSLSARKFSAQRFAERKSTAM
jgi:nucleotide-binding universal stress UspA family protein